MPRNGILAVASGVNFPWIIYKDLVENEQILINNYTKNFYYIEIGTDIYNAIFNHKKENFKIKDYIQPYLSKTKVFAVFSISDMKPFLKLCLLPILRLFHMTGVLRRKH